MTDLRSRLTSCLASYLQWVYGRSLPHEKNYYYLSDIWDTEPDGRSLVIYDDGGYTDFNGGAAGDVVGLYADKEGIDYKEACRRVEEWLGSPFPVMVAERPKNELQRPWVNCKDKRPPNWRAVEVYEYGPADGSVAFLVGRIEYEGGKTFQPCYFDGNNWVWKKPLNAKPYPLWKLPALELEKKRPVLVVEGEKCVMAAQRIFPEWIVTTWSNGSGSVKQSDFKPLEGRQVVLWPDNDEAGEKAMDFIMNYLGDRARVVTVDIPHSKPPAWDIADCEPEEAARLVLAAYDKIKLADETIDAALDAGRSPASLELNQLGNIERFLYLYGKDIRYNVNAKEWMFWDGRRFRFDHGSFIWSRIVKTVRDIENDAPFYPDNKKFMRFLDGCKTTAHMAGIENGTKRMEGIAIDEMKMDAEQMILNCENGILDLKTGELRPHERELLCSKLANVVFDPACEAPEFLKFLGEIMCDREDLVKFLQQYFGYCLTGLPPDRIFSIFYGTGRNGKSTIVQILSAIMGDYHVTARIQSFLQSFNEKLDKIGEDLIPLRGARMVSLQEADKSAKLNEQKVKELTGRDKLKCRYLHSNTWLEWVNTGKFIMSTNHKPRITGSDSGIWDRVKLVPFEFRIPDDKVDQKMAERIIENEASGILNWMLAGLHELIANDFKLFDSKTITDATKEYRIDEDVIGRFFDACCFMDDSQMTKAGELFELFKEWVEHTGESSALGMRAFGEGVATYLAQSNIHRKRVATGNVYPGIGIKDRRLWKDDSRPRTDYQESLEDAPF